ncbi:MAG: hypothetical protein ACQERR_01280 [Pseudomonadota bacterium]
MRRWCLAIPALLMAASAQGNDVERSVWEERMIDALPEHFCADGTYFRECFRVDRERCLDVARESVRECLRERGEEIPERLLLPREGREWGAIIGRCAGRVHEETLADERRLTSSCRDPEPWR